MEDQKFSFRIYTLFIIGFLLAIVTGGGTNAISQITILLYTGGLLVVFPPKYLPGKWFVGATIGLLMWLVITMIIPLPFAGANLWLREAIPDLQIKSSISSQPYLSFEKSLYLLCGLSWLYLILNRPLNHYYRIRGFRLLCYTIFGLGIVVLVGLLLKTQHPFTWGTHKFSFFPNHNQNGAVLAMGAILSMGLILRSIKKRKWDVFIYMLSFGVLTFAMFLGMSRSAILILIAGCLVTILLTLEKKNYLFYLKLAAPFFILLLAVFVLYGGRLFEEFVSLLKAGGVEEELRVLIFADSVRLIGHFPVLGVGLGNFRYFIPSFIHYIDTSQAIHHPESDFLWIWIELGLPGLCLLLGGIILLFIRLDPEDVLKSKGIRLIGFVCLVMFLIASMIEVSGHRLGTAIMAIAIYGLVQPDRAKLNRSKTITVVARLMGVFFIVLASIWILKLNRGELVTKEDVHEFYNQSLNEIIGDKTHSEVVEEVDFWIKRYPLFRELYEVKGRLYLQEGADVPAADKNFRMSQTLYPDRWQSYIYQGVFLHSFDFDLAMNYWVEGVEIAEQRNEQERAFRLVLSNVDKKFYPRLRDLTYSNKNLQFLYLSKIRLLKTQFSREFGLELAVNPELNGFRSEQKEALLWVFTKYNGHTVIKRLLESYPVLGTENWTIKALVEAEVNNFKEASRLAVMNLPRPRMIDLSKERTLTAIRREYLLDSKDPLKAIALQQRLVSDGEYQDALVTVQVALRKGIENEYLKFQEPLLYFYLEDYKDSWERFARIIESTIEW